MAPSFSQDQQSNEALSSLRTALQEAKNEHDNDSQPDEDASNDEGNSPDKPATKRPKRARACIACRSMKIRCLPVGGQEACLACSKVNRECVMPGPARKRQKTVHKVQELERKINALTDALINQQQANPTPPNDSPATNRDAPSASNTTATSDVHRDAQRDLERLQQYDRDLVKKRDVIFDKGQLDWGCSKWSAWSQGKDGQEPYADIIDRDLLDMSTATRIFDYYVAEMLPHFPLLEFPPTIFAQDVRTARPMLFLAILAVAAPSVKPDLQPNLVIELTRQLSERIMFLGEKSLEIVQAILVYTSCYSRGKYAKDLTFNQLIHSAVVMCLDLGMGKRYKKLDRDHVEEAEIRRTWLACYYFASNVSILLRHPSLVRWSPYMEECVDFFMKNPNTVDKDKWLCAMVQTQHMAEEVSIVFKMDDPSSSISFGDTATQYHLKAFEKQLSTWHESVPAGVDKHISQHMAASLNLYMHEIAIHHDHNVDDFRPDPDTVDKKFDSRSSRASSSAPRFDTGSFVTTRHIAALSQCLDACHQILDAYLALPIRTARSISNLGIVWNTYAAVALIKLHGVLHAPDSKFGSIFTPDLKVEWYLDSLINRLQEISADGRCPPAEAFVYVVHKLRSWFQHKRAPYLDESDAGSVRNGRAGSRAPGDPVVSHEQHSTEVMRSMNERYGIPETMVGVPSQPQNQNMSGADSQHLQVPTTLDQSQPIIGTSSMPASQLQHHPSVSGASQQPQSTPMIGGGFPSASWNNIFTHGNGNNTQHSQAGAGGNGMMAGSQYPGMSDLNVAYNAQNYNINWDELQFGREELNVFDEVMGERGWMGYLI